jgi:hypothetical protein
MKQRLPFFHSSDGDGITTNPRIGHDFSLRLHEQFRKALASHTRELGGTADLDLRAFFLSKIVER